MLRRPPALLAALLLLLAIGCRSEPGTETPAQDTASESAMPEPEPVRVLFLGDSISAGYGLEDETQAFPALVEEMAVAEGWNVEVTNAGLSGETSAGGLRRIGWVLQAPVDVFVLELGGNDALRGSDLGATKGNLQAILDSVATRYPQAHLVVAGMQVPPNLGADYTAEFAGIFPALADANDATLIPFLMRDVGENASRMQSDGIHPNAEGHRVMAETTWEVLEPILAEAVAVKEAECTVDVEAILAATQPEDVECGL